MTDDDAAGPRAERAKATSPAIADPPPDAPPSPLETRYRRLLRMLPPAYRAAREEEMVATFLAAARDTDPDNWDLAQKFDGPDWAEKRSVLALALGLRWGPSVAPERYEMRLGAVRLAVFAYLVTAAGMAVVGVVTHLVLRGPLADLAVPAQQLPVSQATRLWITVSTWAFTLWIPALVCALRGGQSALRWAAGLAAVPTAVEVIFAARLPVFSLGSITTAAVDVVVVAALAALASLAAVAGAVSADDADSRTAVPHERGWLVTAAALTAALAGLTAVLSSAAGRAWIDTSGARAALTALGWAQIDAVGPLCWAVVLVAAVFAVRTLRGRAPDGASLLGLALFAAAVTVLRAGGGVEWARAVIGSHENGLAVGYLVAVAAQLAVTATISVISASLAARRFRRLPAARYATGARR